MSNNNEFFFFQNTGQLVHKLDSSKPYTAAFLPLFLNELIIVACSFIFTNVKTSWRKLLFWKIHYQSWPATSGWKYFCEFELSRSENLSTYQQINGAGAANICLKARARTTPARVCSAPPRGAALGWSLEEHAYSRGSFLKVGLVHSNKRSHNSSFWPFMCIYILIF